MDNVDLLMLAEDAAGDDPARHEPSPHELAALQALKSISDVAIDKVHFVAIDKDGDGSHVRIHGTPPDDVEGASAALLRVGHRVSRGERGRVEVEGEQGVVVAHPAASLVSGRVRGPLWTVREAALRAGFAPEHVDQPG